MLTIHGRSPQAQSDFKPSFWQSAVNTLQQTVKVIVLTCVSIGGAGYVSDLLFGSDATSSESACRSLVTTGALASVATGNVAPLAVSVINCIQQVGATSLNDGLIAYYPFNGNANDESGNGRNGIITNAKLAPDRFGIANKSYSFENAYITANGSPIQLRDATISYWAKLVRDGAGEEVQIQTASFLTAKYLESSPFNGRMCFGIFPNRDGQSLSYNYYLDTEQTASMFGPWIHIAFVVYDSNTGKVYLNGRQISLSNPETDAGILGNYQATVFGATYNPNSPPFSGNYMRGQLDSIHIYNRTLSDSEVYELFLTSPKFNYSKLIHSKAIQVVQGRTVVMSLDESILYLANSAGGLKVYDSTNPIDPTHLETIPTNNLHGLTLTADGKTLYAADLTSVKIFNTTNASSPVLVNTIPTANCISTALTLDQNTLYLPDYSVGLKIYNVSDPYFPSLLTTISANGANGAATLILSSDENTIYLCDRLTNTLRLFNNTVHGVPTFLSSLAVNDVRYMSLHADKNILYVADYGVGLKVYNVTNSLSPTLLHTTPLSYAYTTTLSPDKQTLFVSDESNGLKIFNITIPEAPVLQATLPTFSSYVTLTSFGRVLYSTGSTSFNIYEISNSFPNTSLFPASTSPFPTSTTLLTNSSGESDSISPETIIGLAVGIGGGIALIVAGGAVYYFCCRNKGEVEAVKPLPSEPIEIEIQEKVLKELELASQDSDIRPMPSEFSDADRLTLDELYEHHNSSPGVLSEASLRSISNGKPEITHWLQDHSGTPSADPTTTVHDYGHTPTEADELASIAPSLWAGQTELSALSKFQAEDKNLIAIALQRGLQLLVSKDIVITQTLGRQIIIHTDSEDLSSHKKLALKRTFTILCKTKDCVKGDDIALPWSSLNAKQVSRLRRTYKEQLQLVQDQQLRQDVKHSFSQEMTALKDEIARLKYKQGSSTFSQEEKRLLDQLVQEKAFMYAKDRYFSQPEHASHLAFYRQIQASMNQLILGMDVIQSGFVDRAKYRFGEKAAKIVSGAAKEVPFLGVATSIVSFVVDQYTEDKELDRRQPFVKQIVSPVEMSVFSQNIALELTEIYEQQLGMMSKVGAENFAHGIMRKIWKEISSDNVLGDTDLAGQVKLAATQSHMAKVISREIKAGKKVGKEVDIIDESNGIQTKRWKLEGILHLTGIRVKNDAGEFEYYARPAENSATEQPATMEWEFGFRLGTPELVAALGMERVSVTTLTEMYPDVRRRRVLMQLMREERSGFLA